MSLVFVHYPDSFFAFNVRSYSCFRVENYARSVEAHNARIILKVGHRVRIIFLAKSNTRPDQLVCTYTKARFR